MNEVILFIIGFTVTLVIVVAAGRHAGKGKMTTPLSALAGAFIEGVSLALAIYWEWRKGKE